MNYRMLVQNYIWILNLVLLTGVCYLSAGALNSYVVSEYFSLEKKDDALKDAQSSQSSGVPAFIPDINSILSRDLFKVNPSSLPDLKAEETDQEAIQETNLRLKLLGIFYLKTKSNFNVATISNIQQKMTDIYHIGDTIDVGEKVEVTDIKTRKVALKRANGAAEWLSLEEDLDKEEARIKRIQQGMENPQTFLEGKSDEEREKILAERRKMFGLDQPKIREVSPGKLEVPKKAVETALADLNTIITQARVIPNIVGEGENKYTDGFRIFKIQRGSIFEQLGMQNGDIIKSINGQAITGIEQALSLLQTLRTEAHFSMELDRNGETKNLDYDIISSD